MTKITTAAELKVRSSQVRQEILTAIQQHVNRIVSLFEEGEENSKGEIMLKKAIAFQSTEEWSEFITSINTDEPIAATDDGVGTNENIELKDLSIDILIEIVNQLEVMTDIKDIDIEE